MHNVLTSTEVADVLPALAGRTHGEHDALREGIQGIQQLQLRIATCAQEKSTRMSKRQITIKMNPLKFQKDRVTFRLQQ